MCSGPAHGGRWRTLLDGGHNILGKLRRHPGRFCYLLEFCFSLN
jgi:hypothetical protein